MEEIDIQRATRRAEAYWYDDGLGEISAGFWGLLLALAFLIDGLGRAPFRNFGPISMMVLCVVAYFLGRMAVRPAKARWVFPRTGEVRYRSPGARGWMIALVVAGAFAWGGFLILSILRHGPARQLLFSGGGPSMGLCGASVSALLLVVGRDSGWQRRIVVVAGLALLVGAAVALSGLHENLQLAVLYGSVSLALVVSGGVAFAGHLRHAPAAEAEADGR